MSRLDVRNDPNYSEALGRLPAINRPLVGAAELDELNTVVSALPRLRFPIDSAGDLIDQLGEGEPIIVFDVTIDPARMIKYMPSYYFPVSNYDNLIEKMAQLLRENRRIVDESKYSKKIHEKSSAVEFPIENIDELRPLIGNRDRFNIGGRWIDVENVLSKLPDNFFPVADEQDLERKSIDFLRHQPLIEPHISG